MKKHTLPIILSSIVALTVATQNSFANVSKENLKSSGTELLIASLNFGEALWVATSDAIHDGIDATKDAVNQAGKWVGDKLYEARTGMVELQDRMIETAIETGRNVRDWGVRVARNTEEMIQDGWEQVGEYWIRFSDKMHDAYGAVEMFVQTQTCRFKVNMKTTLEAFRQVGEIPKEKILEFHTCLEQQDEWAKLASAHGHVIGQDLKCYGVLGAPNSPKIYDAFVEMYNARIQGWNESCGSNATAKEVVVSGVPVVLGPIEEAAALAKNVAVTSAGASIVSQNSASDYSTECPRVDFGVIDNAGRCQDACKQYEELHVCLLSGSNPYSYNSVSKQCICNPDKVAGSVATTNDVAAATVTTATEPTQVAPKVGDACSVQYSTSAQYINVGGEIKCAATACQSGSYLVKNNQGVSMGWCKWGTDPEVLAQQRAAKSAEIGEIAKLDTVSAQVAVGNSLATQVSGPVIEQRAVTPIMDPVEMARKQAELAKLELEAAEARQKAEEKQMKVELKAAEKQERQEEREANQLARQQEREANQLARQEERDAKAAEKEAAALAKAAEKEAAALAKAAEKEAAAKAEAEKKAAADAMGMTVHQYDKYQQNMAEQELLKQQLGII